MTPERTPVAQVKVGMVVHDPETGRLRAVAYVGPGGSRGNTGLYLGIGYTDDPQVTYYFAPQVALLALSFGLGNPVVEALGHAATVWDGAIRAHKAITEPSVREPIGRAQVAAEEAMRIAGERLVELAAKDFERWFVGANA